MTHHYNDSLKGLPKGSQRQILFMLLVVKEHNLYTGCQYHLLYCVGVSLGGVTSNNKVVIFNTVKIISATLAWIQGEEKFVELAKEIVFFLPQGIVHGLGCQLY